MCVSKPRMYPHTSYLYHIWLSLKLTNQKKMCGSKASTPQTSGPSVEYSNEGAQIKTLLSEGLIPLKYTYEQTITRHKTFFFLASLLLLFILYWSIVLLVLESSLGFNVKFQLQKHFRLLNSQNKMMRPTVQWCCTQGYKSNKMFQIYAVIG